MTEKFQNGVNASMVIQWENEFRGHLHLLQTFHEQGFEAAKEAYRAHKVAAQN
jgi:hypothetical protein